MEGKTAESEWNSEEIASLRPLVEEKMAESDWNYEETASLQPLVGGRQNCTFQSSRCS